MLDDDVLAGIQRMAARSESTPSEIVNDILRGQFRVDTDLHGSITHGLGALEAGRSMDADELKRPEHAGD